MASAIGVLALAITVRVASGAAPSDQQIDEKMRAFQEWYEVQRSGECSMNVIQARVTQLLSDVDIGALSIAQVSRLHQGMFIPEPISAQMVARLEEFAKEPTEEGAAAAIMQFQLAVEKGNARQALAAVLDHPALGRIVGKEAGAGFFAALGQLDAGVLRPTKGKLLSLERYVSDDMAPEAAASLKGYYEALCSLERDIDAAAKERIRVKLVRASRSAAEKAVAAGNGDLAERLNSSAKYLDSAFTRGKHIDHVTPPITFIWSSANPPIKSIADLKGKIIVLDFWTTWCIPCVGSFPHMRELQKRYDGYPVVILGITSLQGVHVTPDRQQIQTKGDAQKEFGLMRQYIRTQKITWNIAFSDQDVFNPDFDVRGIPHMAIIDADGIVRYNGLHPSAPVPEMAEKIDALLRKAKLRAPGPLDSARSETGIAERAVAGNRDR